MRILTIILSLVCVSAFGVTPGEFKKTKEQAEKGDAIAQYNLGLCYANGIGVSKDKVEASVWYRKSAEQGHDLAQNNLGALYFNGDGVPRDPINANFWYKKSAEQGCSLGQLNYGLIKAFGEGVARDPIEGHAWLIISAENNTEAKEIKDKFEGTLTANEIQLAQSRSKEIKAKIEADKKKTEKK